MLAGVWWGPCKVPHNALWSTILLEELATIGHGIEKIIDGLRVLIKVKIGMIIMDSVAKPKSMNIIQFNGYYGCPYCTTHGKHLTTDRGGNIMVYPYKKNENFVIKDHSFYLDKASNGPSMGVKGPSVLTNYLKFPNQIPIDYMHCVLEGVFKSLMSLKPYCNTAGINKLDSLARTIKLPHEFTRKFRKFSEISYWKAHECKTFMLYLVPLFKDLIDSESFVLIMAISVALRILIQCDVSKSYTFKAHELIMSFMLYYQQKYGKREMKFNFHLLLHLKDQVVEQGSLIYSSAFVYENHIHALKRSFHGTRGQLRQICRSYLDGKSLIKNFTTRETHPVHNMELPITIIGKQISIAVVDDRILRKISLKYGEINPSQFRFHSRIKKGRTIYHSISYTYKRDSTSYYFCTKEPNGKINYGRIEYFLTIPAEFTRNGHDDILIIYTPFVIIDHLGIFSGLGTVKSTHLKNILRIARSMHFHNKIRLTERIDMLSLNKLYNKAIVYPNQNDTSTFWGTCFDQAYEHD